MGWRDRLGGLLGAGPAPAGDCGCGCGGRGGCAGGTAVGAPFGLAGGPDQATAQSDTVGRQYLYSAFAGAEATPNTGLRGSYVEWHFGPGYLGIAPPEKREDRQAPGTEAAPRLPGRVSVFDQE